MSQSELILFFFVYGLFFIICYIRMINYLIMLLLIGIFIPLSIETPIGFISLPDIGVIILTFITLAKYLLKKQILVLPIITTLWFIILFWSWIIHGHNFDSLHNIVKMAEFLILIPIISMEFINKLKDNGIKLPQLLIDNITIIGGLWCLVILIYSLISNAWNTGVLYAFIYHKNDIGLYASIVAICSIIFILSSGTFKRKIFGFAIIFVSIAVVLASGQRSSWAGFLFGVLIIFLKLYKNNRRFIDKLKTFTFLLFLTIICFLLVLQFPQFNERLFDVINIFEFILDSNNFQLTSASSRILLWEEALDIWLTQPLIGTGPGSYNYPIQLTNIGWLQEDLRAGLASPHNLILHVAVETGIIGLIIISLFLVNIFKIVNNKLLLNERLAIIALFGVIISYLVTTQFEIPFKRGTGHLFWFIYFVLFYWNKLIKFRKRGMPFCKNLVL